MNDLFISYAHIDDLPISEDQKGWITEFHRILENRLSQLMGEKPKIWRDQKLSGSDIFDDQIVDQFSNTKLMVVDEKSMVSTVMMHQLDQRLREVLHQ